MLGAEYLKFDTAAPIFTLRRASYDRRSHDCIIPCISGLQLLHVRDSDATASSIGRGEDR